ncbi:MAG TPA: phosphatidylinositol mannoside acyltransferase, partial [Actinomycetota bacterium]|nr:phosphatidylinositol mannoside acyltransferase [Actinomycetota bacterium]
MVARNMARVAGAYGPGAGDALVKDAYLSYARYWLETFRLGRYSLQELLDMVDSVNIEIIDEAVA